MSKSEKLLEQALYEIAMEETSRLSQALSFRDMQKAKDLQHAHSKTALSLIRKNTRSASPSVYLRTAAVIAVIVGGIWLLRPASQPPQPAAPPTVLPLQPFVTASVPPTAAPPSPTYSPFTPTEQPIITEFISPSPTLTPLPTDTPAPTPTSSPTFAPTPEATAAPERISPWSGRYFPAFEKDSWLIQETDGDEMLCAVMDDNYVYTEYTHHTTLSADASEEKEYRYVMVGHTPALLTEDRAGQYTLTWDVEDRTLSIFAPDGDAETLLQIAESIKQVTGE